MRPIDRSKFAFPSNELLQLVIDILAAKATKWDAESENDWEYRNSGGTFIKTVGDITLALEYRGNFIIRAGGTGLALTSDDYHAHPDYEECVREFNRQRRAAMFSDEIKILRDALTKTTENA